MHPSFADWYQPVTFNHDREIIELRWNGVEAATEEIESIASVLDLVHFVFEGKFISSDNENTFRNFFKNLDPTFTMAGNDKEVQVLAGCFLALYCVDEEYDWDIVPLSILTMSANLLKSPKLDIDLIGMAEERALKDGINARKRPELGAFKKAANKKNYEAIAAPISEAPQSWEKAAEATKKLGSFIDSSVNTLQASIILEFEKVYKSFQLQDEELQMLWWMVGGWSDMWSCRFSDVGATSRPIMLAIEAANITTEVTESPSLKAVFSRVEISTKPKVSIPEAVNDCGLDSLEKFCIPTVEYPKVFPVLFAINRAKETGADESWINAWSKATGINTDVEIDPLALAVQVHRECKLLSMLG